MKTIKSIDRKEYSLWLVQYPNDGYYAVGYSTPKDTKVTHLISTIGDAMDIFDGVLDFLQGGGGLQ